MNGVLFRRLAVFTAVFVPGMSLVAALAGGIAPAHRAPDPEDYRTSPAAKAGSNGSAVVSIDRGPSLGPGLRGTIENDSVAIVGNRPVAYRAWMAEWTASEPQASPEPGVSLLLLRNARLLAFPVPTTAAEAVARADAPGTTSVQGRECLLRQREQAPPSAHLEGDAVAQHAVGKGQTMTLRSEVLEFRTEERGPQRTAVRIVETDRAVRLEGGGASIDGTGLLAELEPDRPRARIEKDVTGVLVREEGATPVKLRCSGPAFLETVEGPSRPRNRESPQPWRATFRRDVRIEEAGRTLTADEATVDFVRTTAEDQAAGARAQEIRRMTATGDVVVEADLEKGGFRATSDRLHRFAEDVLTSVSVFEGSPRFTLKTVRPDGRGAAGTKRPTILSVRCDGPARLRERRARLASREPEAVTVTFEGDVVALETDPATGETLGEVRAPLVTFEGRRGADGNFEPHLARAEGGATLRRPDASARGRTIVWTARRTGAEEHLALIGEPVVVFHERHAGSAPGSPSPPGIVEMRAGERIDVDFAPPTGTEVSGRPARARASGGMTVDRRLADAGDLTQRLRADRGEAVFGPKGELTAMSAWGKARLESLDGARRRGFLAADRISASRRADADPSRTRFEDYDVGAYGSDEARALAVVDDVPDESGAPRHHELRARSLRQEKGGTVLVASDDATADLRAPGDREAADPAKRPAAPQLRLRATATGAVEVEDAFHRLVADRATYDVTTGLAETWGAPVRLFRDAGAPTRRTSTDTAGGTLEAPHVRAWYDRAAKGHDSFVRAVCPEGGTLVVRHFAAADDAPAERIARRVTITSDGPMELSRDAASAVGRVVSVWERELPDRKRQLLARIDARRVDATLEASEGTSARDAIRSLVATGPPDDPARLQARDETGRHDAVALAERMEVLPGRTKIRLGSPAGGSRVSLRDVAAGRRILCDRVTYDYATWEWEDFERAVEVE